MRIFLILFILVGLVFAAVSVVGDSGGEREKRIKESRIRAFTYFADGDFEGAIQEMERLKKEFPMSDVILSDLALLKHLGGKSEEACDLLERRVEKGGCEEWILRVYASAALGAGRFGAALRSAERVLEKEPTDSGMKGVRAAALYELGAEEKALQIFEEAVLEGEDTTLLRYGVDYLSRAGRSSSALSAAERYIELSDSADGYILRASVYCKMGEPEKAIEDYKKARQKSASLSRLCEEMIKRLKESD
ncbi:MAG: tetratricopeptide repeat protein [Planctomycetota bacterium]|nr:tetratricopeptide repeat protein [Planctomycetota bacterium]